MASFFFFFYCLSLLYNRLVGVKVLDVQGETEEKRTTRVYAHCSSRYNIMIMEMVVPRQNPLKKETLRSIKGT